MKKNIKLLVTAIVFAFSISTIMAGAMQKKGEDLSKNSYINNFKISSDTESENEDEAADDNQMANNQLNNPTTYYNHENDPAANCKKYEDINDNQTSIDLITSFDNLTNKFKEIQNMISEKNKENKFKGINEIDNEIKMNKSNPFQYNIEKFKKDLEEQEKEEMFDKIFNLEDKTKKYKNDFEEFKFKEKIKNHQEITQSMDYYYKTEDEDKKEDPKINIEKEYNDLIKEVNEYVKNQKEQSKTKEKDEDKKEDPKTNIEKEYNDLVENKTNIKEDYEEKYDDLIKKVNEYAKNQK